MEEDTRKLITFERTLGMYEVAGAICSYGDVIDFVDGEKKGIVIADTTGKMEECGKRMGDFLRKEIKKGWGSSKDGRTEILDLGKKLFIAGVGKPYLDRKTQLKVIRELSEEDRWWDGVEICYAHMDKEIISLAGLRYMIFREEGGVEEIDSFLTPYHINQDKKRNPIEKILQDNDILLMTSDGLEWNMRLPYRTLEELRKYDKKPREDIRRIITKDNKLPVDKIRDALVTKLSNYIVGDFFADDVTFAVVKRI